MLTEHLLIELSDIIQCTCDFKNVADSEWLWAKLEHLILPEILVILRSRSIFIHII